MSKALKGDVIQINERNPRMADWCGCLMFVTEEKTWGVMAGMRLPQSGTAFLRVSDEDYDLIGQAALLPGGDE